MERKELISLLEFAQWRFAKTMPQFPHDYTLRKTWPSERQFEDVVTAIREFGKPRRWFRNTYVTFYAEEYMYWTMGATIKETILINRALR